MTAKYDLMAPMPLIVDNAYNKWGLSKSPLLLISTVNTPPYRRDGSHGHRHGNEQLSDKEISAERETFQED